jgi:hypothetical protein
MNWRCGSSSGMTALQVQSPEFKPQSYKKKKKYIYIYTHTYIYIYIPFECIYMDIPFILQITSIK